MKISAVLEALMALMAVNTTPQVHTVHQTCAKIHLMCGFVNMADYVNMGQFAIINGFCDASSLFGIGLTWSKVIFILIDHHRVCCNKPISND